MKWRVMDTSCLGIPSLLCSDSIVHGRAIVEKHSRLTQSTEILSYETDVSEWSFGAQADARTRPKGVNGLPSPCPPIYERQLRPSYSGEKV